MEKIIIQILKQYEEEQSNYDGGGEFTYTKVINQDSYKDIASKIAKILSEHNDNIDTSDSNCIIPVVTCF